MENSNIELIKTYFTHFLKGEMDNVFALLDDQIVWRVDGSEKVPTVGIRKGKKEVRQFMDNFAGAFEPREFVIQHYLADVDKVFTIGYFTHFIKSLHQEITGDFMIEFVIKNNKICSYKILEDSYALYAVFNQ